jgi:hypothetical protein
MDDSTLHNLADDEEELITTTQPNALTPIRDLALGAQYLLALRAYLFIRSLCPKNSTHEQFLAV